MKQSKSAKVMEGYLVQLTAGTAWHKRSSGNSLVELHYAAPHIYCILVFCVKIPRDPIAVLRWDIAIS